MRRAPDRSQRRPPDQWEGSADPPRVVQVTLLPDPYARPLRERIHVSRRLLVGFVPAACACLVALAAGTLGAGRSPTIPVARAGATRPGPWGVAAAYGYPLRCLSITIDPTDRVYARADFDHGSPCGRYDGDVTAIFHRVDHAWRPVLDATGYGCPVASLSAAVQSALDVCPQRPRPGPG